MGCWEINNFERLSENSWKVQTLKSKTKRKKERERRRKRNNLQKIPWIMETNSKDIRQCQNHRMTRVQFRHQNSRKILFSSKPAMFVVPSVIIHEKNVATTLNRTHPKKNISSTPLK